MSIFEKSISNKINLKRTLTLTISLSALLIILSSWGSQGHYKINTAAGLSFNAEMAQLTNWVTILANHASDADYRKAWDPNEAPKHYIDIDNYEEFILQGTIPQNLDSAIAEYGAAFVHDQGYLPWATLNTFDSLVACMARHDWDKAVLFAADLGHYVADGHMPMHITRNYNGQYSDNYGIHSRYESTMINYHISEFIYTGYETNIIEDVDQYIFNYIYNNYSFVDSILSADDYAKNLAGNTNSVEYKEALWDRSKGFTIPLFKEASHSLSELIYTAWVIAGSPLISYEYIYNPSYTGNAHIEQIAPNPIVNSTFINYRLKEKSDILLNVVNLSGQTIATLVNEKKEKGLHTLEWDPLDLKEGVYIIVLVGGEFVDYKKIVIVK